MTNTMQTAKELTFGTELEYTNISRERAVKAIHSVVGGTIRYTGGGYDEWTVIAPDGRHWKAVSDGSLGSRSTSAEVVTPILKWDDLDTLQAVVRELRKAGAKTPECTSQHVHIGVRDFNARQIANFARIFYKQEELLLKAAGTLESRLRHYTQRTDNGNSHDGWARSPIINVPQAETVTIQWRDWHKGEDYQGGNYDSCYFYVHDLDTGTQHLLTHWYAIYSGNPYQPYWVTYNFDISEVAGHRIQVYLLFTTLDGLYSKCPASPIWI